MHVHSILNSLLTTSSVLVAFGFPFIIFVVSDYKNNKEKLSNELEDLYPKLNSFRKLIHYVFLAGVIEDYDKKLHGTKNEKEEFNSYPFYRALKDISKDYERDIINDFDVNRRFSLKEVVNYKYHANRIWHSIHCRTDVKKELIVTEIENSEKTIYDKIREAIAELNTNYITQKLNIELIASIAGQFEFDYANKLVAKTKLYEKPLPKTVSYLFCLLTISLIVGIIIPLTMMYFPILQFKSIITGMLVISILCFAALVIITSSYLKREIHE